MSENKTETPISDEIFLNYLNSKRLDIGKIHDLERELIEAKKDNHQLRERLNTAEMKLQLLEDLQAEINKILEIGK